MTSVAPVGRATRRPFSSTSSFRTISTPSTRSSPRIATGETRKRSTIRRGLPASGRAAYSRSRSTLRRTRSRSASSSRSLSGSSSRSAGSTTTSAPCELAELLQLGRREGRLHRAAPAEHHELSDARTGDRLAGVVDRVGRRKLLGRQCEHADAVDRDVPVPDHDRRRMREVERELLEVGMAVVPGDERRRGPRAGQVFARDAQSAVGLRADRVEDGVVELGRARRG